MDQATKTRETWARRAAQRQGLKLQKSRRRDPRARGYGSYGLHSAGTSEPVYAVADGVGLSLDQVEHYLRTGECS